MATGKIHKSSLVQVVADRTNIVGEKQTSIHQINRVITTFIEAIVDNLAQGRSVTIAGLGTIKPSYHKGGRRLKVNAANGTREVFTLPEATRIKLNVAKEAKVLIQQATPFLKLQVKESSDTTKKLLFVRKD